ncbi:hypothetical protein [Modestobacter versicolor]|uniref:hypothetical protein n=1 Tax=Modestobacter versicolor TaxID=429133 RepID=UPI0034D98173
MQYDDTINDWHTNPETGRINASNPAGHGAQQRADDRAARHLGPVGVGDGAADQAAAVEPLGPGLARLQRVLAGGEGERDVGVHHDGHQRGEQPAAADLDGLVLDQVDEGDRAARVDAHQGRGQVPDLDGGGRRRAGDRSGQHGAGQHRQRAEHGHRDRPPCRPADPTAAHATLHAHPSRSRPPVTRRTCSPSRGQRP